eukprot:2812887-Pyramimonas_sp.AAC.1
MITSCKSTTLNLISGYGRADIEPGHHGDPHVKTRSSRNTTVSLMSGPTRAKTPLRVDSGPCRTAAGT